jgi:hypothetical protein
MERKTGSRGVLGVLLLLLKLLLMVVLLELRVMLLGASCDVRVLIGEDAYDTGGDFVMDDGLVVFA